MKLFMLWDMEGCSGIWSREQVWYWEPGVRPEVAQHGRELLMADINSAVSAALAAGADEVIVCDTHGGGGNIVIDRMLADPRVSYLQRSRGYQGDEYRWLPGLDRGVDAFMLPGHHAMAGTDGAFLPHTWSGEWADFQINGRSVGELGIEACYAGHWDIPTVLMQGDEAACREAEGQFPGIVTAAVKRARDHDSCVGLEPEAARALTARKVADAIEKVRRGMIGPYRPSLPMTVSVRFRTAESVAKASRRPGIRVVDEFTVEAVLERQCDIVMWLLGTGLNMASPQT